MTINVNPPPQIRLPKKFAEDREINTFFRHQNRMLLQLWKRTGGGTDSVDDLFIDSFEFGSTHIDLEDIDTIGGFEAMQMAVEALERIEDLENRIDIVGGDSDKFELITIGSGDTAFTTTGNQVIICNNTAALTITLNLLPDDGEKITVIRRGSPVSLVGILNGSTPTPIPSKFDILDVYFTLAAGEWSA